MDDVNSLSTPRLILTVLALAGSLLHAQAQVGLVCELDSTDVEANDALLGDRFGAAIAVDGDWMVIGSPEDDDDGTQSGAAYVYELVAGSWTFHSKIVTQEAEPFDLFGTSVTVSGDIIAVGAPGKNNPTWFATGAAYVFRYDGADWNEEARLEPVDAFENDRLGTTIDADGDRVLVGAPDEFFTSGTAYTFTFDGSNWSQEQKLVPFPYLGQARFGESVALAGNRIVCGSPFGDDGVTTSGNAFLFEYNGSSWLQTNMFLASDRMEDDYFGTSVDLAKNGTVVVVGAPGQDAAGSEAGAAYAFRIESGVWVEAGKVIADDAQPDDGFGMSVAASGGLVVVGAPNRDVGGLSDAGGVYVYLSDGPALPFRLTFEPTTPIANGRLGQSVHAFTDHIVAGAPGGQLTVTGSGTASARRISGAWDSYGTGLAGSGGFVPLLASPMVCPTIGDSPVFNVTDGLGGAPGLLLLAQNRATIPFRGGTLLLFPPQFGQIPHVLGGTPGAPGEGTWSVTLPPTNDGLFGLAAHAQVGYLDPGAIQLVSLSNGIRLSVP